MNIKAKLTSLALAGTLALSLTPRTFAAISPTTFHDVKTSDWYYSAVDHVVTHGYFNGVGDSTFAPSGSMSRAMAVTVLARMFGGDLSAYTGRTAFTDVPAGAYYAKAVQWAVEQGIASGTSATTFSPDAYATREQISVFLYNAVKAYGDLGTFNSTVLNGFTDRGRVASWADTALQWATYNGIINGDGGKAKPKDSTTRAAFATISMNYDSKYDVGSLIPTPEPNPTPTPGPKPDPEPAPTPDPNPDVTSMENQVNDLLVSAWQSAGQGLPARNTGKLAEAARVIASGSTRDTEDALTCVGFDKPMGTIYRNKYVYDRYGVKSFFVTTSSVAQAVNNLRKYDSLVDVNAFTDYGIGVYQMNDIQFRVAVVTYDGDCYTKADITRMQEDWLEEQANLPVTLSSMEQQVLDLTNQERAKHGLAPLEVTADMQKAAHIRTDELLIRIDAAHIRPDGRMPISVLNDINSILAYNVAEKEHQATSCNSENNGYGQTNPSEVVSAWMNSTGHRRNILNPQFTHIGIGVTPRYVAGIQKGYYWEQIFIGVNP